MRIKYMAINSDTNYIDLPKVSTSKQRRMYLSGTFKNYFRSDPQGDHQATYVIVLNLLIYIVINASGSSTYSLWVIRVGIGTINQNFHHNEYLKLGNNFNPQTDSNHKTLHHTSSLQLIPSFLFINFVLLAKTYLQTNLGMLINCYLLNLSLTIYLQGIHQ